MNRQEYRMSIKLMHRAEEALTSISVKGSGAAGQEDRDKDMNS